MTLALTKDEAELDLGTRARLESEVRAALRRRPAGEARLAGVLRALAPLSLALRTELGAALEVMVRRASFDRPLYGAAARALTEQGAPGVAVLVGRALSDDSTGGLSTLSAACFCREAELAEPLARIAAGRQAHLAFAAEIARLSRGESDGSVVTSLAPKIKESHRIALCLELLVPLLAAPPLPVAVAPALGVLRDAERHLGRWLVLAEVALRAGDVSPRQQARERAESGAPSARAAWALVYWALAGRSADPPQVRPTVELVARLSDRPSADKDTTFLFRLAQAAVPSARAMLESLAKSSLLGEECAVRAMLHLCRDYGEERYRDQLHGIAANPRRHALRGLAAAALFDVGDPARALPIVEELGRSRHLSVLAWSALTRRSEVAPGAAPVVTEANYRRVQQGWVE